MNKLFYETSIEHLLAELKRIDVLIMMEVESYRQQNEVDENSLRMYGVTYTEVDTLLKKSVEEAIDNEYSPTKLSRVDEKAAKILKTQSSEISKKKQASLNKGITLRLQHLIDLYQLSHLETDIMLIALAPELSMRYQRFYAYLQDDKNKIAPSINLILKLLYTATDQDSTHKFKEYSLFSEQAKLIQSGLIYLEEDAGHVNQPLLNKKVKVDERVRDYLLDSDALPVDLNHYAHCHVPQKTLDTLLLKDEFKNRVKAFIHNLDFKQNNTLLYLRGAYGTGKQSLAESLCRIIKCKLLIVDMNALVRLKPAEFAVKVPRLIRESDLQDAALYIQDFDALIPRKQNAKDKHKDNEIVRDEILLTLFINNISKHRGLTFFSGDMLWEPKDLTATCCYYHISMPVLNTLERQQLWRMWQKEYPPFTKDIDLMAISDRFQFTPGQIRDAFDTATSLSQWRDPNNNLINSQDLAQACRLQSNRQLTRLAQNITPHYEWDDLILPPATMTMLEEIRARITHHALVYEQWGFDRKLAMGKGLHLLFSGAPGTGKTMAADVIANVFEMALYKIDLSSVVSKYIGETEKNLSEIFHEGETSNAVLFFDEADALFGKRTEVKDSHDRHANIEVGYLLQRMEHYAGIVILSTNFRRNMDDAFVRRLHYCVDFPMPEKVERLRIWQKIWPKDTPLAADIDLNFLAERLQISGGYIRNIALSAAFMAAEETTIDKESEISMSHLFKATRREYQKMGQILKQSTLSH